MRTEPPLFDPVAPEDLVSDVLDRSPARIAPFVARGMACPGCAMAGLMTLREAANAYGVDLELLLEELGEA
jgi:hybrid cluster-associated redox disulfide protein